MEKTLKLSENTIALKATMAVSGVVLLGFVVGHLAGNLNLYAGPEAMNGYAAALRRIPELLWGARLVLIAAFVAHVVASFQLHKRNRAARPVGYAHGRKDLTTSYAAKTMVWSGPIVLLYLIYHLAHLTFGISPGVTHDPANVYNNVVHGFQVWWISAVYIVANLALGIHLFHGAWSFMQSLGVSDPRITARRKAAAAVIAGVIVCGNLSFPLMVLAGVVEAQ